MERAVKKDIARQLYLFSSLTQREVAERAGVTEKTLSKWINGDKERWKDVKGAMTVTKQELIRNTYLHIADIQKTINEEKRYPTPAEVDSMLKLSKVIENLEGKVSLPVIIQVLMEFEKYLMAIDPEVCKVVNKYHQNYINAKINEH